MAASPESTDRISSEHSTTQPHGGGGSQLASIGPRFSSQAFMTSLSGPGQLPQRLALAGGALALAGSFLPFYVVNLPAGMGSAGSFSFINTGLPGGLAILAAIGLAGLGIMPGASPRLNVYGWGLATLVLGMLLYAATASGFEQMNPAAAMLGSRGIGFYLLALGYVLLEYVYIGRLPR